MNMLLEKEKRCKSMMLLAGGLGFEPRLAESESAVLPLDDPPLTNNRVDSKMVAANYRLEY